MTLIDVGDAGADYWTSPALPYLESQNSPFPITTDEMSLIPSIFHVGALIGLLLYTQFVDRIGRKYTLLLFSSLQIISWALIFVAQGVNLLYVARLIGGIGYAGGIIVKAIYVGEIAEKNIRGLFIFFGNIAYCLGSLITVSTGAFLSYDAMNLVLLSLPILFVVIFPFMPESPYFYLKCKREKEAVDSFSRLRGTTNAKIIEEEITRMKEAIIEAERNKKNSLLKLFESKRSIKGFMIILLLKAGLMLSGMHVIRAYCQEIFNYSGFSIAPEYSTVILTFIVLVGGTPTAPLADYIGRRMLTLYSAIICSLSLFIVGVFFFLKFYIQIEDLSSISWIPLVALIVYQISWAAGIMTSMVLLSSELFSVDVKSSALSLSYIAGEFFLFIAIFGYKRTIENFGIYGLFWMYAVACLVLPLMSIYIMPETKGKTLEEIQKLLDWRNVYTKYL